MWSPEIGTRHGAPTVGPPICEGRPERWTGCDAMTRRARSGLAVIVRIGQA